MAGADRAINMPMRVQNADGVARDFRKVGDAGAAAFEKIEVAANKTAVATRRATSQGAGKSVPGLGGGRMGVGAGLAAAGFNPNGITETNKAVELVIPNLDAGTASAARLGCAFGMLAAGAAVAGTAVLAVAYVATMSAVAWAEHERALAAFNATLDLAGNLSTATSAQISQMAQDISDTTLQTEKSVLQAAASLAQVPGITEAALQSALEASAQLADTLEKDVTETAKQTGEILTALADRDMKALIDAMNGLDPSLQMVVLRLAETGKVAEAQTALINGLKDAAGDGPDGLATATDTLSESWDRLRLTFGDTTASPVIAVLNGISFAMDRLGDVARTTARGIQLVIAVGAAVTGDTSRLAALNPSPGFNSRRRGSLAEISRPGLAKTLTDRRELAAKKKFYGGGGAKARKGGGGRGSGKSDAQRAAEQAAREAEALAKRQAGEADRSREAADRIIESNQDVIDSYKLRAAEAQAKIGLEGAALKAVERVHEIDAAERRINIELIEKEVEARRAAAIVAKQTFNEPLATEEARRAVALQSAEVRLYAAALIDAGDAIDAFNERQAFAKALLEETRTPIEAIRAEAQKLSDDFARLGGDADAFNRKMDQLAENLVDAADRSKNAWVGFGDDIAGTFTDILLNGGSARDLLEELIRIPLERLIVQNFQNPLADLIDGFTGNNRDKNIAAARDTLPTAADASAVSVTALGGASDVAAQALMRIPQAMQLGVGDPLLGLADNATSAGQSLAGLAPQAGQLSSALGQLLSSLGAGGGGAGGILGAVLSIAGSALGAVKGGGLAADGGPLGRSLPGVEALLATPGFAGGGYPRPGTMFSANENGKELFELTRGGGLRIHSNEKVRQMESGSGGVTFVNNQSITVPERADKRRTGSYFARQTERAIYSTARKGLARGPGR